MNKDTSFPLHFQKDLCTGCGLCADSCAYNAIDFTDYPQIDSYSCRLCGSCVQACPAGALTLDENRTQTVAAPAASKVIWVLAETNDGQLEAVSKELLGKATELSLKSHQSVEAILIGQATGQQADELIAYGAQRVHIIESEQLATFVEENYVNALAALCKEYHPETILVGATPKGRGISARLAALLNTGLTADCTELDIDPENGLLQQIRPAFGGNLMATIVTPGHRPQMASVRHNIMKALEPDTTRKGEILRHNCPASATDNRVRILHEIKENNSGESLGNSRIIVGVGRGVKSKETVNRITQWAKSIGAVVAGSRAAVEAGLIDPHRQIGQTGQTVNPELYIAIGISGQIQHTAGIGGAKKIIAINPDRTAPIFQIADYGWETTIEEALPQLAEQRC